MQGYRHPDAEWLGSPNFTVQRDGHEMAVQPAYVVLHTMVGTIESANGRFQNADPNQVGGPASATYGVGLDGRLVQWVDEADAAWANGTMADNPGSNLDSIAIEHEDDGNYDDTERTPDQYRVSALLVRDICQRYGIPIDRAHVLQHRQCIHAQTSCPDGLDVDRIVRIAAGQEPVPSSAPGTLAARVQGIHVPGRVWRAAIRYRWSALPALEELDTVAEGTLTVWTEAAQVEGGPRPGWYDRLVDAGGQPSDVAVHDQDLDDTQPGDGAPSQGWDPTHFGRATAVSAPTSAPAPPPAAEDSEMSQEFGPTTGDSYAAGFFQGKPAGPYSARDVWASVSADEALGGAFPVVVAVYFVPAAFDGTPAHPADIHTLTIGPSEQKSVRCGIQGEVSVRIQHVSGGPYVGRVYAEFPAETTATG